MILLARHGETDYNAPPRRIQGQRDVPLNDRGREQARALAQEAAALWERWKDSVPEFRFPGGESLQEHMARTWAALDDIAAEGRVALVVCHGGTIRCALARNHPGGIAGVGTRQIPNGALIPLR